jgi:hypothetical protein
MGRPHVDLWRRDGVQEIVHEIKISILNSRGRRLRWRDFFSKDMETRCLRMQNNIDREQARKVYPGQNELVMSL